MEFRDFVLWTLVAWNVIDLIKVAIKKWGHPISHAALPHPRSAGWQSAIMRSRETHTRYYSECELRDYLRRLDEASEMLGKVICADGTPGAFGPGYGPYGPFFSRREEDYGEHRIPSKAEAIAFQLGNFASTIRNHVIFEGEAL